MKRVRILFSALAVVLAAGSAFSTVEDRRAIVYYQSTTPGATCAVQFNSEVCEAGNDEQCRIDRPDPMPDLYISKRVDGGVCEEHWRQAQ